MQELEHLRSMWKHKIKRKTDLIVSRVTYVNMSGSLNNEHWEFKVPYAFRDALDIKYEQRRKDKKPYRVWTQGPILSFKEGDVLTSANKSKSVQVQFSNCMGWDTSKDEMYEGNVVYEKYGITDGIYSEGGHVTCTQMQFLELLICGKYEC